MATASSSLAIPATGERYHRCWPQLSEAPLHVHVLRFLGHLLSAKPALVTQLRTVGIWELAYGHHFFL